MQLTSLTELQVRADTSYDSNIQVSNASPGRTLVRYLWHLFTFDFTLTNLKCDIELVKNIDPLLSDLSITQ